MQIANIALCSWRRVTAQLVSEETINIFCFQVPTSEPSYGRTSTLWLTSTRSRNTLAYDFTYTNWGIYLAAIGFCCISPNYRGSKLVHIFASWYLS